MTDKIKNQRGITLIALIVTIIVLIILAAVGISMLLGDNGITEKARWSKSVTEFERIDEQKKLYMTEQQINEYGKVPKRIQKFSFQSLFTNISYASDSAKPNDTIYPIIQGDDGKVDIKNVEYTLRTTIKKSELQGNKDRLNKPKYVDLRKVDLELLGETKVEREYVINVAEKGNGELYWLNKVPYQGLAWHTPRAKDGVDENAEESDYAIYYLPEEGKEEGMYTQDIPNNNSGTITLESIDEISNKNNNFKPEGKLFAYWKDVTDKYEKDDDEEEEEATGNDENSTEDITRKTYEDGAVIDLETDWWLQGGNIYLEAEWQYGVILNPNGGTIEGQEPNKTKTIGVIEGKKYGDELNTEPTREGYVFKGWYTDKDGGTEMKSSDPYYASYLPNSTLYAHWEEITFSVTVTDVTNTSWTQGISITSGNLTGYMNTYYISTQGSDDGNASTQTTTTVSGRNDNGTYYVWAVAKNGDVEIKSNNYMVVKMGHKHSGSWISGTGCYNGAKYQYVNETGNSWTWSDSNNKDKRYCSCCGNQVFPANTYGGAYLRGSSSSTSQKKKCTVCGRTGSSHNDTQHAFLLCSWCYGTCYNGSGSSNGNIYGVGSGNELVSSSTVSHDTEKHLNCGLTEQGGSAESNDF